MKLQEGYAECLHLLHEWFEDRGGAGSLTAAADIEEARQQVSASAAGHSMA